MFGVDREESGAEKMNSEIVSKPRILQSLFDESTGGGGAAPPH